MSTLPNDPYAARVLRVVEYIELNLDGDLSLDRLSEVAGLSKFHFHRLFSAYTGTTVAKLARNLRLKKAAWQLAFLPNKKVIEIALEAGFSNHETFSRSFRALQGQSPTEFREDPQWIEWRLLSTAREHLEIEMNPTIVEIETIPVAVLEHRGPPAAVMTTVSRFIEWRKKSNASPEAKTRTLGIIYDDPKSTEPESFRFDVCGELIAPLEENSYGIVEKSIPGGRCAVVTHVGSLDNIGNVVREMYRSWLPTSGEKLRDFPRYFHYRKRMPSVPEHEQETDIHLPLE